MHQDNKADTWQERLAKGDPVGLEMLYDEFGTQFYRYALGMIGHPEAAEDSVQELFLTLAQSRSKLGKIHSPRAYLFAMLRHAIWRRLRSKASEEFPVDPIIIFERSETKGLPTGTCEDIESALAKLSREQKEVIVLKVYQNMTFSEIATVTDVPANTAASRYRYALERLKALLPADLLQKEK